MRALSRIIWFVVGLGVKLAVLVGSALVALTTVTRFISPLALNSVIEFFIFLAIWCGLAGSAMYLILRFLARRSPSDL